MDPTAQRQRGADDSESQRASHPLGKSSSIYFIGITDSLDIFVNPFLSYGCCDAREVWLSALGRMLGYLFGPLGQGRRRVG
jgi:hypothetical protein